MCSLYEKFRKWIQYNGPVLFIAFSIALIVYYPFYSDMLSNPDGVLNWEQMEHPSWMLSQADLSGFILDYFKPKISMVQLPIFFSLAFYCLSGVLLSEIFNVENYCAKLVIAVCVVCSPFVPSTITYPYLAYAFGFYFLLAVVAVKFLVNNQCKLTNILIGGLLLVFLLGGGKTFIGVSTALVLMNFIFATIEDPKRNIENGINLIIQMATVLISAMLFYCILKIALAIAGMSLSTYGGANKITPWHIVVNLPKSIIRAYSDFFDFFFSSNIMINSFNVIFWNKCIFALFVLLFIYYCVCLRDNIVSLFFFILSVVVMPLACNLIDIFAPDYGGITLHMAGGMVVFIPFVFSLTYLFTKSAKTLLKKNKSFGLYIAALLNLELYSN